MQYPIGRFEFPDPESAKVNRIKHVKTIGGFPDLFAAAALKVKKKGLLSKKYREGGWTARQVIHHVADSHTNAYVRFKRIITEDHPTLTPYDEKRWARLGDINATPIEDSLHVLRCLHRRMMIVLGTSGDLRWQRTAFHPGADRVYQLDQLAAHYAWHGQHHLGHLRIILDQAM